MGERELALSDRERLAHLVRSTDQKRVLISLALRNGWRHGAEIGVLRGKTLFAMLRAVPGLRMYAVDQWKQLDLRPDENAETYVDFDTEALFAGVSQKAVGYGDRCRVLRGDSVEMAERVADGSLDFVFIDGDHTEVGVERDIRAWAPKVRIGGTVLGHDHHWTTVHRVINRLCPGWQDHGEAVWGVARSEVRL